MPISYRQATSEDKNELCELGVLLNSFNLAHDLKENLFWEGWEKDIQDQTEVEIKDTASTIYLAESEDNEIIGYILVMYNDREHHYEVDQLFVKDAFRSQKVGAGLMDFAIKIAKDADSSLELEVYSTNKKAINFYKKLGFKETGVVLRLEP